MKNHCLKEKINKTSTSGTRNTNVAAVSSKLIIDKWQYIFPENAARNPVKIIDRLKNGGVVGKKL